MNARRGFPGIPSREEMGLDSYAVLPCRQENGKYPLAPKEAFNSVPGVLVGGLFSGHGDGPSFRGRVYDGYVSEITGESLYQEYIPPEVVKEMASKLEAAVAQGRTTYRDFEGDEQEISLEEARALAAWFRVCADNGFAVVGWW